MNKEILKKAGFEGPDLETATAFFQLFELDDQGGWRRKVSQ